MINGAVNGVYYDPYFGDAMTDEGYEKRLRAVVQNRLTDFSDAMRNRGEDRKIVDDEAGDEAEDEEENEYDENQISRASFVSEVRQRMRRSRGCELPGTFNPLIISELFYLHSKPWTSITENCIELLLSDVQKALLPILTETVDDKSSEGLLRYIVNPRFDELEASLKSKTAELLEPQRKGHPITYNHYFVDCVQKAREEHRQKSLKKKLREFFPRPTFSSKPSGKETHTFNLDELIASLATETETDMEKFACSEAIDCMMAYYKVARKKFVDDFSNLAVEKCLLEPLSTIFTSRTVNVLEDSIIEDIAAEDESSRHERQRLEEKTKILQTSLHQLYRLDRHHLAYMAKRNEQSPIGRESSGESGEDGDSEDGQGDEGSPRLSEEPIPADDIVEDAPLPEVSRADFENSLPTKKRRKKHPNATLWE